MPVRIALRPFGQDDFDRLISWLPTEDDLVDWCAAYFRYPLTRGQLERYLENAEQQKSQAIFTALESGRTPVGHVEISHIWPHLSSRLSRVLVAPDRRRRGIGSTMVRAALSLSFRQHHVDRIDLGVSAKNAAAIGFYEKLGFAPVGTWPNAIGAGAQTLDVPWMKITNDV